MEEEKRGLPVVDVAPKGSIRPAMAFVKSDYTPLP
jgi:hypothetical protein